MPRSLNRVTLLGHLGADAETKYTAAGVAVTNFNLATERRWKDKGGEFKSETDWHRIVSWRSENVSKFLTKGRAVLIEGRLQTRSYEDKGGDKRYVTEVIVENLILLGEGGNKQGSRPTPGDSVPDDDVPF